LNPHWNESYNFDITTGKEVLTVTVVDSNRTNEEDYIGRIQINISELSHQKDVEHWFDLIPENDIEQPKGRINLGLRWVHSKVDMLRNMIADEEHEIQTIEENIQYYSDEVDLLKIPLEDKKNIKTTPERSMNISANNTLNMTTKSPLKNEFDNLTLAKLAGTVLEGEHRWALNFERTSNNLSIRLGFDETPWFVLFQVGMYTNMFLTFL
jgi:Ca2+-dependent lipid-binding protein